MKRLIVVLGAVALVVSGCAQGARSGGAVDTGPSPQASTSRTHSPRPTAPVSPASPTAPTTGTAPSVSVSPTGSPEPTRQSTVTLEVWFDTDDNRLGLIHRTVPATEAVGRASLEALLAGPSDREVASGIGTQIPPGTDLLDLSIAGGVATVDLSRDYFSGGSAVSEWTRLGQVVFTMSQFSSVDGGVNIQLDGDPIRPFDIDGNFLDRPWVREDFEQIVPAIVIQSPTAGQSVGSPVPISGTADVFEATVSLRLLDEDGNEIANGFTTATCGTGCRGTFEATLDYRVDHGQRGTVEAFEASAEDGHPINVADVPVTLAA
jgi:hypothetical protein